MKKICFINGSPKVGESTSLYMIDLISQKLESTYDTPLTVTATKLMKHPNKEALYDQILSCNTLVIVFPLYVDCLPSSLLEILEELHIYKEKNKTPLSESCYLYALVNCGFMGAHQNANALRIIENYAEATGFVWGGGVGFGGGEMIRSTKDQIPLQSKIALPIYKALCTLIESIKEQKVISENSSFLFADYKFPKFLFNFMGNMSWNTMAKENGITKKEIYANPLLESKSKKG